MIKKLLCMILACALLCSCTQQPSTSEFVDVSISQPVVEELPTPPPPPEPKVVKFSATGDNLIHDGIYMQAKRRAGDTGYDFKPLYENVESYYSQFDVNWLNQETLVTDALPPATYPTFCSPEALGQAVYDVGFNVFAMSNNHSYDKGAKGIEGTLKFWGNMPSDIVYSGFYNEETFETPIHEVNGIKIAYLAYTQYTNGIPVPQNTPARVILTSEEDLIKSQIEEAKQIADFVVVGVHWGNEDSHKETEGQRYLGNQLANWGADAIIGTHPHVAQPVEWIDTEDGRRVLIVYSLGNFVSAQSKAANLIGLSLSFDIVLEPDAVKPVIKSPIITPIITHYDNNYGNIRAYLYKDYTNELALKHGVRANNANFSKEFIDNVLTNTISPEFLTLT